MKQSLERLQVELHGYSKVVIRNQIKTMKHWVYSWMTIGGVESQEEFNVSYKNLTEWLNEQKNPLTRI